MKKATTLVAMVLIAFNTIAKPPMKYVTQSVGTFLHNKEVSLTFTDKQLSKLEEVKYDDDYSKYVKKYVKKQYKELNNNDLEILTNRAINLLVYVID